MSPRLADLHLADLHARAQELGLDGYRRLGRDALIEAIAAAAPEDGEEADAVEVEVEPAAAEEAESPAAEEAEPVERPEVDEGRQSAGAAPVAAAPPTAEDAGESEPEPVRGVLELTRQGYGFVRLEGLEPGEADVYISASQVRRCELRPGDEVSGPARPPRRGERHRALVHVDEVNGREPLAEARPDFDALAAVQPKLRLPLDRDPHDVLARSVDLLAPLALGQRVLVRAAPRSGRTTLLRSITRAAAAAADEVRIVVLLIDERPEEATPWREAVPGAEFAIATADTAPNDQARIAGLALERARRLAERGFDAVLICDSLSRLAVSAGAEATKRLFGSGRKLPDVGSLTVVATVLAAHDDGEGERAVITTESALLTLDGDLAAAGVVPALDAQECRVSNEEELRSLEELEAVRRLRSMLADLGDPTAAAGFLRERIEATTSNAELLGSLGRRLI